MFYTRGTYLTQPALVLFILLGMFVLSSCGEEATDPADTSCGEHGEMHGSHCHCDAGYSVSDDGLSCELQNQANDTEPTDDGATLVFDPANAKGSVGDGQDGSKVWLLKAMDGDTILHVQLYAGRGAPTIPGVVDITESETDYSTCGTCLVLQTGCFAHGDHYDCTGIFMPRAEGELHLNAIGTAVGEKLTGELKNIVFQEVSMDQNYSTTPIAGGEQFQVDSLSFDVQLEAP